MKYHDKLIEYDCKSIRKVKSSQSGVGDITMNTILSVVDNDKEAEWVESLCGFDLNCSDNYRCSKCGNTEKLCTRFCSWCGRSMKDHKGFYWRIR